MLKNLLAFGLVLAAQTFGASFSFTGSFSQDDQNAQFVFALAAPGNVTIRTFGYAGGVNFAGDTIPDGGFDPIISLFLGTGPSAVLFNQDNDAGCGTVGTDPTTNACWDASLSLPGLPAGTYTLVLTQADSFANGPTLGDGFGRDGQGNFTGPAFTTLPGSFFDGNPAQRTSNWAVDILEVDRANALTAVPEPASIGLAAAGLALLATRFRRRR